MTFSIIAAVDKNLVIGKNNDLPWGRIPADMKHFRETTAGHTVIMGQRTFESLGKPLPSRRNIVLSTDATLVIPRCEIAHSIGEACSLAAQDGEVFIIGGGSVYKAFMPIADKLYITFIEGEFQGDTYFPDIDPKVWQRQSEEIMEPGAETKYSLRFVTFKRKV